MKTKILLIIRILLSLLFISCSDKPEKILGAPVAAIRVEPSDCMNCNRCITDFKCPRRAISIVDNKAVVNAEKCVSCQLCITDFKCPYNAFKDYADVTAPSAPANFRIEDSTATSITVSFDDSFDDYNTNKGFAAKYIVKIGSTENFDFAGGLQIYSGKDALQWQEIINLQPGETFYFKVVAYDEVGNASQIAKITGHTLPAKGDK